MKNKLFVLVDETLEPIYGAVQGGHAVAKWLIEHPNGGWNNDYLIYLSCNIGNVKTKLDMLGVDCSVFEEPDLDGRMTAIAVHGNDRLFRRFRTLGYD